MAIQTINIGTTADDGTGDSLREAFKKTEANFTELYNNNDGPPPPYILYQTRNDFYEFSLPADVYKTITWYPGSKGLTSLGSPVPQLPLNGFTGSNIFLLPFNSILSTISIVIKANQSAIIGIALNPLLGSSNANTITYDYETTLTATGELTHYLINPNLSANAGDSIGISFKSTDSNTNLEEVYTIIKFTNNE